VKVLTEDSLSREITDRVSGYSRIVLCGVGNDLRGDDAVGTHIVDRLLRVGHGEEIIPLSCGEVPENYLSEITDKDPSHIIVIDGANVGQPPGTIVLVETDEIYGGMISTHRMPLSFFARMIESKADRHVDIFILGIQIASYAFGEPITPPVLRAADRLVDLFSGEIPSGRSRD